MAVTPAEGSRDKHLLHTSSAAAVVAELTFSAHTPCMDEVKIRHCAPGDYGAVVAIYNYYIENSHTTFDTRPYSIGERAPWFSQFNESGPYQLLVATQDDAILGYCCSTQFNKRPAYDVSVETSVYLDTAATGKGIGKRLYEQLLRNLSGIGLHGAYAGISLPNDASVKLHELLGFRRVGVYKEVGWKFNKYWSVAWYELRIQN
jgi:phosphinothricin acetyltransferase